MTNSRDILEIIRMYYPKDLRFENAEYKASSEFLNRTRKLEKAKCQTLYSTQLYLTIKKIFDKYEVINWTDMESFNCYEYRILLHQNQSVLDDDTELMKVLGGKRIDLFLFLGVLSKNFYFFVNETTFNLVNDEWKFNKIFDYPEKINKEIEDLILFLDKEGYSKIDNDIAHEIVRDIETELIDKNKVMIFNCLFTDLILI